MRTHSKPKSVYVRRYDRRRFGRMENVRQHWRSRPFQYRLFD